MTVQSKSKTLFLQNNNQLWETPNSLLSKQLKTLKMSLSPLILSKRIFTLSLNLFFLLLLEKSQKKINSLRLIFNLKTSLRNHFIMGSRIKISLNLIKVELSRSVHDRIQPKIWTRQCNLGVSKTLKQSNCLNKTTSKCKNWERKRKGRWQQMRNTRDSRRLQNNLINILLFDFLLLYPMSQVQEFLHSKRKAFLVSNFMVMSHKTWPHGKRALYPAWVLLLFVLESGTSTMLFKNLIE